MTKDCQFWQEYEKAFREQGIMISPSHDYCEKYCKKKCPEQLEREKRVSSELVKGERNE